MAFIRCRMNVFGSPVLVVYCYTKIVIKNMVKWELQLLSYA